VQRLLPIAKRVRDAIRLRVAADDGDCGGGGVVRELPKNPNTRPPYSDVYGELSYYVGEMAMLLGVSRKEMGEDEWKRLGWKLAALDQALLRTRAVLDPVTLSDEDWEKAKETAWQVMTKLAGP
jgi:hypothetical protein